MATTQLNPIISGETAANLASATATINTSEKYAGKLVRDTTNNRLYMARGTGSTDPWDLADGSASVTPA
jgi:hypothetical protein